MTNFKSSLFSENVFLTSVKLRVTFCAMFAFVFFSSFAAAADSVYRNAAIVNANTLDNGQRVQSISELCSNVRLELNSQALLSQINLNDDNSKKDGEEEFQLTPDKYGSILGGIVLFSLLFTPVMLLGVWLMYRKKLFFKTMLVFSIILSTAFIIAVFVDIIFFNKALMKFIGPLFAVILVCGPYFLPDKESKAPEQKSEAPVTEPKK